MRFVLLPLLLTLAGCSPPPSPPDPSLWGGLQPGPFRAGFGLKWEVDPTRRDPATKQPLAMPVAVWYPALDSRAPRMRLGDYFDFRSSKRQFNDRADKLNAMVKAPANAALTTAATRDAPSAKGPFPVIIYAPAGLGYAEDAMLCEFLATQGYLVLSTPAAEDASRLRDMIFLLRTSTVMANADPSRVAAIGRGPGADAVQAWAAEKDTPLEATFRVDAPGVTPATILADLRVKVAPLSAR